MAINKKFMKDVSVAERQPKPAPCDAKRGRRNINARFALTLI